MDSKMTVTNSCRYYDTCDNELGVYDTCDHRTLLLVEPLLKLYSVIRELKGLTEFSLKDLSDSLARQDLRIDDESLQTAITALFDLRLLKYS
jgi:hypothetical protein